MRENNPAGRLLNLIEKGQGLGTVATRSAWASILEVDETDAALLMERLASVYRLPGEIRQQVAELPDANVELLLTHMPSVEQGVFMSLDAGWNNTTSTIDAAARYSLDVISDLLSRVSGETVLPDDEIERLLGKVRSLLDEVAQTALPVEYRLLLTRHLRAMQSSLEEVRVRGADGLRDAVEAVVGSSLILETQAHGPTVGTAEHRLWGVTKGLAVRALLVLNLVQGSLELGSHVIDALPLEIVVDDRVVPQAIDLPSAPSVMDVQPHPDD